jgi:hypothetical protein
MITDIEADRLADEYPNASPERKPQIETALRTWVTAAEAEAADRAREGAARLRQSFKSVSDLGGLWTKEQELRLPPTDNPDEVKARVANTAFLAEAGGMDYDTAAKTYEGLRARWAQATLGKKDAGDLEMYSEVSRQYQDGEDKAKLAFQRDADAASRGFQRALENSPPDWSTPESEWRKGAEKAPGFDANWGFGLEQSVAYRDAFQRAFKVATEHRPLVLETLDTLKRGTKWINQGAGLSEEAAARLMELPDAERADVLRAIVAGAASMSPEDPGAAVSNLQKVFKNMGISASRGLDALRLSKVSQALSAADAASALEAIKDGKPVYDLGGGRIATSLAAVQGAFGLEVSMQAADPVPASEIPALTKKLEGTLKFFRVTNELEKVSRQYLDPIRPAYKTGPGWVTETMAVGLAGSAPQMVAGAIPGVGLPWMTASFVDSAYERIVADQPDIDPRSALAMATVAGTIEGGIEMLQIRNAVGLLPATSKLVQAIRTPNVNLFKVLGIQVGANIAEQNLEEALQDLALPTVKAIGAALNKDIEGVNWAQEWQEFGGTRLETFLSVLPLAILGAGAAGIRETTAFRNLLASEQALVEYGLPREVAASIASQETPEARQAVFFEEQSKRTPESIRAGIAEAEARVARETVAATSNETPTMVYEGGKFRIVEPDGSSSMAFDDPEAASLALQSRNEWEESGAAVAVRELADWLGMRDSDKRKWEVVPKIVTLEDDTLATPEQIAERMQLAGLEGLAPSEAQVFGQNVTEVRDGVVRVVNSVFIDSNPFDVIEEEVHFRFRQERDAGIITREEAEAAVRSFQGEKAPQTFSDQALEEAVAEMGRDYFGGNFRFIQNMPKSVRSFFLRMAKFFRETFRNAAKLKKLIREGKIDANWVAFLNRSVGLTEAVQEQEAAMKAAQEIAGQTSVATTAPAFSLGTTPAEVIEPPAVAELQGLQTVEVPVDQLKLSADVPQFKRGAIGGIVKPLEGKFDKTGVGPIQVWMRLNGDLEVISGRHRWDLAKRSGIATIPAQVHEESKGFTAKQAATLDAELNIRDEQGSVADFAVFFRNSELTEEEAKAKGYLQRVKGQQGWTIGKNASEDVFAAHQAARINDAAAAAVAASAPNDSSLQAVGLKAVLEGKNADFAGNLVKAYAGRVEQKKSEGADFGDLFSFDDSAIKEAEQEAALVSKIQKDIREDIRSVRDAARFPQRAKKFGVNVNKPETVLAAVTQLESELMKWEGSWFMDPELKSKLKQMKETGQIIREPQVRFSIGARQVSPETPDIRFSVGRKAAPYAEQLAAQMDALKTKPAVRIQIYERARKKFTDLVARHRAAIAEAQAADTRKPAEIIEEAKATHDAEVARIDAERDAALAAATTDKERNTARLVHGTKLRAANVALSKALAAATGEGTRQARTAQVVGELNAILSAFPAEVRGRVGGFVQLASLKTETGRANELSRRLAKAETELEKLLRKEYRAQLDRVLDSYRPQREAGKKPKGKIGAQAQEILDAAEAAMIMDAAEVAALVAKYDLLANDPDASPEDVIKNGTIRDILPLLGDIKNADSARLVSAIDAVKLIGSEGWARWKFQQLQLKEDREIARKGLVQDTGKTGVRAERVEAEKNAVSVAGKSLTALLNLSSFSQVVDYLFGAESKFGSEFKKREMEASNQLEDKMDSLNTAISDLFTEMAGGVVDGERLHYKLSQRSIKTDQGEFSELEALTAVLMWMQEDGKRHMIGKLDENGQPAGAWHYNQDFVDALTKSLSPEAVKVMDWLRKQYDAEHAELNPLYQKRHGVSLPKHENYSPISANPQQTKLGQTVDPVSGAPVSGSILTPGSLRSRSLTAVAEPNFRDALKVFLAHKRSMEHWAAYYDLAVDAQAILAHRDVTNAVDAKAGPEGKTVLTGWLNYFAQGGIREAAASLSISRQLSRMLGRASMMALFGRASTVMVQSTQLAAASVKMPLGAYVLRLSKLISGQLGWGDAIKSEFIQRRLKQAPAIVQQAMQALGDTGKPNLIKHAARQVGKLITGADALFTAGTYAILLDYHKGNAAELNLTGQEADRFAHDQAAQDTEAVAQPTRAANRSLAELTATHPMARLGWSFASEARQKIALTAWAVQGGGAAQVSKTMVLTFIVGGLFTQILKNLWREMKGDDDEEKWSAKRLAIASVTGPLNGIPGFNAFTGDGGTLFSKLKQTGRAVESLLDGEQSAAQVVQGMNTLLSAMGLFSDNAAALSVMGNVATDAAKLLQNVSGEKTSSK